MNDTFTLSKMVLGVGLSSILGVATLAGIAWARIGALEDDLERIEHRIDQANLKLDNLNEYVTTLLRKEQ